MTRIKKNGFIFLLALILGGCSDSQEGTIVVSKFEKSGELIAKVQKMPAPIFLPRAMLIANDKLYVYKEKEAELFAVFNLPDCTYMGDGGNRGQGPDDFGLLDTRSFHVLKNGFNVLESGSNILKTVIFENNRLSVVNSERIFDDYAPNNGFYHLADSMYLTLGNIGESNEYCLFNKKKKLIVKIGEYPQWVPVTTDNPMAPPVFVTYIKTCVVHPNGRKFAAFYGRFKRWRIYDYSANLLHDIDVRVKPYATNFEEEVKNQPVYYIGQPQTIRNYIYVLCANSKGNDPDAPVTSELQVWDWEGRPIATYRFDRKISLMAISEKYNKIYALNNSIEDEFYIYDIPLLKN